MVFSMKKILTMSSSLLDIIRYEYITRTFSQIHPMRWHFLVKGFQNLSGPQLSGDAITDASDMVKEGGTQVVLLLGLQQFMGDGWRWLEGNSSHWLRSSIPATLWQNLLRQVMLETNIHSSHLRKLGLRLTFPRPILTLAVSAALNRYTSRVLSRCYEY